MKSTEYIINLHLSPRLIHHMGEPNGSCHIPTVRLQDESPISNPASSEISHVSSYEDMTYIDWMKESTIHWQANTSYKWTVLVIMSLVVGYVTIFLDLASVWLNDLRKGLCLSKLDRWSLLNPYSTCPADDWYDWSRILTGKVNFVTEMVVNLPIYVFFVCLFVLSAGVLTFTLAPLMKQSGIPEMKLIIAGFNYHMDSYLGPHMLLYKICGLVLVVSSGLWLGSEGPLVHIAGCILTICFERIYGKNSHEGLRRELLSAAAATGIAVAFNSPIGGVLFVVELLPSYFSPTKIMWNSFVSSTIALVALYGFKVFTEGENYIDEALFDVSFGNISWFFMESIPFVLLGILGGFFGYYYTNAYLRFAEKSAKRRLHLWMVSVLKISERAAPYVELVMVGLVTSLATFPISMTKMPLRAFLKVLFTDCPTGAVSKETNSMNFMCDSSSFSTVWKLAYIFVQGFFLSSYSYGLSLPGGVLMPSLVMGATVGRLFGIISQAIQNKLDAAYLATCTAKSCLVSPSSYAVVGAASFTAGITKLTLSVVVIIFELTGAVSYVIPIMISVITAKFVNDWLCEENIYDAWLRNELNRGTGSLMVNSNKGDGLCVFSNLPARVRSRMSDITIQRFMSPLNKTRHLSLFPRIPYDLREIYGFLADDNHEGYPLVSSEESPVDLGYLPKKDVYKSILSTMGNVQSQDAMICFRAAVPSFLEDEQRDYEQEICNAYKNVRFVPVVASKPTLIVKETASLKQVLEIFERLQLNYLIIHDASKNSKVSGFIDRFMVSEMMRSKFLDLQTEPLADQVGREFEID